MGQHFRVGESGRLSFEDLEGGPYPKIRWGESVMKDHVWMVRAGIETFIRAVLLKHKRDGSCEIRWGMTGQIRADDNDC